MGLKILLVHGYAQNIGIFKGKTGALRRFLKKYGEMSFIEAPFALPEDPDFPGQQKYGWYVRSEDEQTRADLDHSGSVISEFIRENGSELVVGFSQGATVALHPLLDALQSGMDSFPTLKGVLMISPYFPSTPALAKSNSDFIATLAGLPQESSREGDTLRLPKCLIMGGSGDSVVPVSGFSHLHELLVELGVDTSLYTHDRGHFIPTDAAAKEAMRTFLDSLE
ncbi:Serine hydrolase FSH [Carpediemonas membranifera]|uniref:Serine hydrolase FSH n=1 Tax=Carpediemonas membranifera TaxID=201153 RepID=A0A8J6B4K4_9EUKA|nr:Serine hydrolase FSH [Carpediemonas membranifera]|eukprot:KAG9389907.1 Serine hydrolase FSH [Carpediemonas membranifera]